MMINLFKKAYLICCLFIIFSCKTTHDVSGLYAQRFASLGFFSASIKFNSDSTFEYRWGGDMQSDRAFGTYLIDDRKNSLKYIPSQYDTFSLTYTVVKPVFKNIDGLMLEVGDTTYEFSTKQYLDEKVKSRPEILYYKSNKILAVMANGTLYTGKQWVYSKRRKYFFFGTHYFDRRNPLRKIK